MSRAAPRFPRRGRGQNGLHIVRSVLRGTAPFVAVDHENIHPGGDRNAEPALVVGNEPVRGQADFGHVLAGGVEFIGELDHRLFARERRHF